jgi:hypothetical protein
MRRKKLLKKGVFFTYQTSKLLSFIKKTAGIGTEMFIKRADCNAVA